MTRAVGEIFHGHFAAAHTLHPLVWIVMPLVAVASTIEVVSYVRTGEFERLSRSKLARRMVTAIVALMLVVWVARFFGAFGGPAPV